MVTRHTRGAITWVDLEAPTQKELADVVKEFGIDERVHEEIITPTHYPLVLVYPKYAYLILHFPTADAETGTRNQEIDFIIGKHFLITARYEMIEQIRSLHRVFEAEEVLGLTKKGAHAGHLLERVLKRMYGAIREEMEHASRLLERIEEDMFRGKEKDTVRSISDIGRVLLRFETTMNRQREPLHAFLQHLSSPALFGPKFAPHVSHIEAERTHVADIVSSFRSAASELRATNDSLLSASQNQVMKMLTLLTFLITPFAAVGTYFGMNVAVPFEARDDAFWLAILVGLISSLCTYLFFRLKKWI